VKEKLDGLLDSIEDVPQKLKDSLYLSSEANANGNANARGGAGEKNGTSRPPLNTEIYRCKLKRVELIVGPLFIHMACALTCLMFSTMFHLWYVKSRVAQRLLSRFDYSGIAILITGSTFPLIEYGFACTPYLKYTYLSVISTFCAVALVVTMLPNSDKPNYRRLRGILFIVVGLLAGIPAAHAAASTDPDILVRLFYWALGGVVYVGGALLYVARIPERCAPGRFDFFVTFPPTG
jgi:channel protein (hemolysin III family)